ncbi:hypothetical protein Adi01nite_39310 [Amorphoplanes digitatis]|nr:hypothetical protein Adi01nite_39310 [Actinoplanes digitatis]
MVGGWFFARNVRSQSRNSPDQTVLLRTPASNLAMLITHLPRPTTRKKLNLLRLPQLSHAAG